MASTGSHRVRDLRCALYQQHVADLCRCVNPRPVAGSQDVLSELVQTTDGEWITHSPAPLPRGKQGLVGHQRASGTAGGLTMWTCGTRDETVCGPPLNTHCRALERPAAMRFPTALSRQARPVIRWVAGRLPFRIASNEASRPLVSVRGRQVLA